ncbi:DUF4235 domain-containing protein [Microlunatus antarcticus]|uniref:NhaP-type Na+/H+ or K+/H+ antiporter n=1 Tax=Microlunatus antarcticus TaxID=53388 RepID=A0A7W5P798_9ACTN|nr:DUF4235 domain-containing protein [Microlunatus antarcticus]MBB3327278.1 NhaP-type Na+/H+ or K+/H+ antiporter [Microlunatus antarcticus]
MVNAARLAYRPVGLISGLAAGAVAGAIFKQVWKRVARQDDAPDALQAEYTLARVVIAATIQGAIFAAVKALVDRLGAQGFQKLTGEWPGD